MKKEILNFDGVEFILNYADSTFPGKLEKGKCQGIINVSYMPSKRETEMVSMQIFHENSIAIMKSIARVIEENKEFYSQFDYDLYFTYTSWTGYRDEFGRAYTGKLSKEISIDLIK